MHGGGGRAPWDNNRPVKQGWCRKLLQPSKKFGGKVEEVTGKQVEDSLMTSILDSMMDMETRRFCTQQRTANVTFAEYKGIVLQQINSCDTIRARDAMDLGMCEEEYVYEMPHEELSQQEWPDLSWVGKGGPYGKQGKGGKGWFSGKAPISQATPKGAWSYGQPGMKGKGGEKAVNQMNGGKCYNCGSIGHISRWCPVPKKCHKCGNGGHLMKDCWGGKGGKANSLEHEFTLNRAEADEGWTVMTRNLGYLGKKQKNINFLGQVEKVEREQETIQFVADSGASETVIPRSVAQQVKAEDGPSKGMEYMCANGETITNEGEKILKCWTSTGLKTTLRAQVCKTQKPLFSISQAVKAGNKVVFEKGGSYIVTTDKKIVPLTEKNGTYELALTINRHF